MCDIMYALKAFTVISGGSRAGAAAAASFGVPNWCERRLTLINDMSKINDIFDIN
jgi:hypothetical protein